MTAYATAAQLLERTNVLRLAQLAVPTAGVMPAPDLVRAALLGQGADGVDAETQDALVGAVTVVATALADGADLMRSYGVPAPVAPVPLVLVRLNCGLAMHYLLTQAGAVTDADSTAHKATLRLLEQHAAGQVQLVPATAADSTSADAVSITSSPSRYGPADDGGDW